LAVRRGAHWDLSYLMQLWNAIETRQAARAARKLIYQEGSWSSRDPNYFHQAIGEI